MQMKRNHNVLGGAGVWMAGLVAAAGMLMTTDASLACTRAVYLGKEGQVVTGRSMDWMSDLHTNMWITPRETKRSSGTKKPYEWTSRYGSVTTTAYDGVATDGMNEKGLVVNMLYLAETVYPPAAGDDRPSIAISSWAQVVLDSYASVAEAVEALKKEEFRVETTTAPTGEKGSVHLSISDGTGDSAILEYVNGKLVIHHGKQYQVMTNSPTYDKQLSLNEYWKQLGGTVMLPGTNRASDRFARASFYINAIDQTADPREAVAGVFSVMRNVSVPRGISTPGQPNISSTLWRTVSDHKNRVYYYESSLSPSLLWVRLGDVDFAPGSGVRKLTMHGNPDLGGNQTANFKPTELFSFMVDK
jgi:penicillin V acylase-like amidase (Ntn superfamily)